LGVSQQGSSKTRKTKLFKKKNIWAHRKKCGGFFVISFLFFSLGCLVRFFFNRVFGRFVTGVVQKRDLKKSRENLLSFQKKHLLTYVTFFFSFVAPLAPWAVPLPNASSVPSSDGTGAEFRP
jgi:hypothetical protein